MNKRNGDVKEQRCEQEEHAVRRGSDETRGAA
jgi:hypothetical protein